MPDTCSHYVGHELDIFKHAHNWKRYFGEMLRPYIGKRVLEVGAGIGGTTRALCLDDNELWLCLEPDAHLIAEIGRLIGCGKLPACCRVQQGLTEDCGLQFDTVLYIDVLEHIADDRNELTRAAKTLTSGGHLVVLAPAHQQLFSEFDRSIGHFRRYNKNSLREGTAGLPLTLRKLAYLDSIGVCLSLANRLLLKQQQPTFAQISFWDRCIVPLSRIIDPMLRYTVGKTIIGVWQKQ